MDHQSSKGLQQFKNNVGIKFQLYNSLFTSLPFHRIEKTGIKRQDRQLRRTDVVQDHFCEAEY